VQLELDQRIGRDLIGMDAADARQLIVATMLQVEADLDEQGQKERHQQAHANRGVWVKPVGDGMARIGAEVDELKAQRFALDLEVLVGAEKVADDRAGVKRKAAQRRADVLAELPSRYLALAQAFQRQKPIGDLVPIPRAAADDAASSDDLPAAPSAGGACTCATSRDALLDELLTGLLAVPLRNPVVLYVHVPVSTVLDLDNRAGYVEGLGPISAYRARLVRPSAGLSRLWVDERSGLPLALDPDPPLPPVGEPDWQDPVQVAAAAGLVRQRLRSMLRPTTVLQSAEPGRFASAALTRFVQARDLSCRGPGCPRTARACELDHRDDHADGGPTAAWNLDAQSPRCHHVKHDGWTVRRYEDGTVVWVSPLGSFCVRRSPWRPAPAVDADVQLPPPTLDRPDGGRSRSDWYAEPAPDLDSRFDPRHHQKPKPTPPDPDAPLLGDWDPPPF
jgi:hypothetical protein